MIHNRERLNRRLMLMQLEKNGQASMSHYSKIIRKTSCSLTAASAEPVTSSMTGADRPADY